MALFITFLLGAFFGVGVLIVKKAKNKELIERWSISLAFGAMIGLAIFDLIPEVIEGKEALDVRFLIGFVILGVMIMIILDKFIPEHNHTKDEETEENYVHIGLISAVAIMLHNVVEGMGVYTIVGQSLPTGISMMFGVGLHNIPMGMLIYSCLQGEKKKKRNCVLLGAGLSTFLGGLIMALVSSIATEAVITALIALALGMVIYIVCFELLPSLIHQRANSVSIFGAIIGFAVVDASILIFG